MFFVERDISLLALKGIEVFIQWRKQIYGTTQPVDKFLKNYKPCKMKHEGRSLIVNVC